MSSIFNAAHEQFGFRVFDFRVYYSALYLQKAPQKDQRSIMLFIALLASFCAAVNAADHVALVATTTVSKDTILGKSNFFPVERLTIAKQTHHALRTQSSAGWLLYGLYQDSGTCDTIQVYRSGLRINTCLASNPSADATTVKSFYFSCTEGKEICVHLLCVWCCARPSTPSWGHCHHSGCVAH